MQEVQHGRIAGEPDFFYNINVLNCEGEDQCASTFMVCGSGGKSMFNASADVVADMDEMDQVIKAGAWTGYPVLIKGNIHYNPSSGYVSFFAYNFKKFPARRPSKQEGGAGSSDPSTPPGASKKRSMDQEAARESRRRM